MHHLARRSSSVFSAGAPASHVYFLQSGIVKIEKGISGNRELLLTVVSEGEIFGEQGIVGEGAFNVSARVLVPGIAYSIPSDRFQQFCARRPEVWTTLVHYLLQRKEEFERKVEHLCHSDVRQRIVYYLEELSRRSSASDVDGSVIHISQNELASLVGATRETTSTTLNALARQGLIGLSHRLVTVPSIDLLRDSVAASKAKAASTPQV